MPVLSKRQERPDNQVITRHNDFIVVHILSYLLKDSYPTSPVSNEVLIFKCLLHWSLLNVIFLHNFFGTMFFHCVEQWMLFVLFYFYLYCLIKGIHLSVQGLGVFCYM